MRKAVQDTNDVNDTNHTERTNKTYNSKVDDSNDTKRTYKDSVFQLLFNDKASILDLVNALEGTNFDESSKINIKTLTEAIFNRLINDLAFEIDDIYVILIEHQSTKNENMALRILLYLAHVLERSLDVNKLHRSKRVKIPTPHFYVLYNGTDPFPAEMTMKLSDAFMIPEKDPMLELEVKIININLDADNPMIEKSKKLKDYSTFISIIRENIKRGQGRDEAIKTAIETCIETDVLKDFLIKYGGEVASQMFKECSVEDLVRILSEEAREDGFEKGIEEGRAKGLEEGLEEGLEKGLKEGLEEGLEKGLKEGLEEGLEKGIAAIIETCMEFGITKEETLKKLEQKFSLSPEKSQIFLDRHWNKE